MPKKKNKRKAIWKASPAYECKLLTTLKKVVIFQVCEKKTSEISLVLEVCNCHCI